MGTCSTDCVLLSIVDALNGDDLGSILPPPISVIYGEAGKIMTCVFGEAVR